MIALVGWLVPGAGYWLIGERARGTIIFAAIVSIFLMGLLVGGLRVIDVPGYENGMPTRVSGGAKVSPNDRNYPYARWSLTDRPLAEIANKPWFAAQILAGPMCIASAAGSNYLARQGVPRVHAPLDNIGTLYTAVAGMLNLFVIIDSTFRAGQPAAGKAHPA
jgi:hypothetical protein